MLTLSGCSFSANSSVCRSTATPRRVNSPSRISSVRHCSSESVNGYGESTPPVGWRSTCRPFAYSLKARNGQPAATASSTMPRSWKTSSVREWIPVARQCGSICGRLSTIRTGTPWRASSHAIVRPVGPAPTTRTGFWSSVVIRFSYSPHHDSAVDVDGLSGHERRCRGAQEGDETCDLLVGGGAAHWNPIELLLPFLGPTENVHARCVDGARAYGVDGDAVARDLHRERLRQALDAEVRRVVGGRVGAAALAGHRREIDDAAPLLLHHDRHDLLAEQERSGELDLEHLAPDRLVQLWQRHPVIAARIGRVVHEDVEAAERLHDLIDQPIHRLGLAHVAGPRERAA